MRGTHNEPYIADITCDATPVYRASPPLHRLKEEEEKDLYDMS
jgi:hypothetical protein